MGPRTYIRGNAESTIQTDKGSFLASMGPRTYIRGNTFTGRARNLALIPLQWGRGLTSSEIKVLPDFCSRGVYASMGPRTYIRGNNKFIRCSTNGISRLQWGRGLTSAEIGFSVSTSTRSTPCFNGAADLHPRKSDNELAAM